MDDRSSRRSVLLLAYACHPLASMESRVGWNRAMQASRRHDTWVVTGDAFEQSELAALAAQHGAGPRLKFVCVPNSEWGRRLSDSDSYLFWLGYALWQRQAYRKAQELHARHDFDLVHQVNFCGFREPGYAWKLDAPFVIGPVGGTQNYPWRFLGQADLVGAVREVVRGIANTFQMHFIERVRKAYLRAEAILTANSTNQRDLWVAMGLRSHCQLETGLNGMRPLRRAPRAAGAPLRILWAGRLRSWKGLPLLLRALARMPRECRYQVRVLGYGPREKAWKRMAQKLGVADSVEWVGWPPYEDSLAHYEWADVFAFTSLRDTSGTGLLEALAAGVPIVGLDHQGAADIMTDECAIRIPVVRPNETIQAMCDALRTLADEPGRLAALSEGATRRAAYYDWDLQGQRMEAVYRQVFSKQLVGIAIQSSSNGKQALEPILGETAPANGYSQHAVLLPK